MDVFAGCGGLSLGLMEAGWTGILAVERDAHAFATLQRNLIDGCYPKRYSWPEWFPKKPCDISTFAETYREQLAGLRGRVNLVAGGPPCQGFSLAGKREKSDPRNQMIQHYAELIALLEPDLLLLENVRGISIGFGTKRAREERSANLPVPPGDVIKRLLESAGYFVYLSLVRAVDFGVPQLRPRWIAFGVHERLVPEASRLDPFALLRRRRHGFLTDKGLPVDQPVTARDALSDLEQCGRQLVGCGDSPGFKQIDYTGPKTHYQRLLHGDLDSRAPNSMRLANHRDETRERFTAILDTCRKGVGLSSVDRKRLDIKKKCIVPLDADKPSNTLTTLPDDLLHYSEPRTLSVRESARLQSFPDWFEFKGNYTTGSKQRVLECPRYTQVGNAVPPFLAEALGLVVNDICDQLGIGSRP